MPSIFSGCFAESVLKSSFRDLGTKSEPKRAKRDREEFKMGPNRNNTTKIKPKGNQKGANRRKCCSKIMPWSVRRFRFFPLSSFFLKGKSGHGALVGLTLVKGTSVDNFF